MGFMRCSRKSHINPIRAARKDVITEAIIIPNRKTLKIFLESDLRAINNLRMGRANIA